MTNTNQLGQKSYTFSRFLKEYLDEVLKIEKIKKSHTDNSRLGVHDQRRIRNNDEKKVNVLNKRVFESMANLIYFFEFLNEHPELISKFGDDIEVLLGLRSHGTYKLQTFRRLLDALLGYDPERDTDNRFSFRRRLLEISQFCILEKMESLTKTKKSWPIESPTLHLQDMIMSDMQRAEVWTNFFDKHTDRENKKTHRIINF